MDAQRGREAASSENLNREYVSIKKDIELHPDAYQHERAERLGSTRGWIYNARNDWEWAIKNTEASQRGFVREGIDCDESKEQVE